MGLGPTNFQAGIAPTNFLDLRDNPPGYADDVFLGYEQTAFQFRNGPEKFAAREHRRATTSSRSARKHIITPSAERTRSFPAPVLVRTSSTRRRAGFIMIPPRPSRVLTNTNVPVAPATQMVPTNPAPSQSVDIWVKVGYQFQINTCYIYYTTDGSNPEGAFGVGKGTTQVVQAQWVNHDSGQSNIDWWKGTIPGQAGGTQVRYKVALFYGGSTVYPSVTPQIGRASSRFPTPSLPVPSSSA